MEKKLLRVFALLLLILLSFEVFALSGDEAIAIATIQNNYLLLGESATVAKELISYNSAKYAIVGAQKNSSIVCYIPVKENGEIASLDLEIRELIKTAIVYTQMSSLNLSTSTANWPFSYYNISTFQDLSTEFNSFSNSILTVKTELENINTAESNNLAKSAVEAKVLAEELSKESKSLSETIESAMKYEQTFFNSPDTNKRTKYESNYTKYFGEITAFKENYTSLTTKLSQLQEGIAALQGENITVQQKQGLQSILGVPVNARKLPTFFSQTDQLRATIETTFNEAKNSDTYAATLDSRRIRNEAWKEMYARNEELLKIDKSFQTLEKAANSILAEDVIDLWVNKDAVDALQANWSGAVSRYNNAEYEKAKEFAIKAQKSVKLIIDDGVTPIKDTSQEIIVQIIIVLVVIVIGVFVFENFYLKKKKKPEDYNEPEY